MLPPSPGLLARWRDRLLASDPGLGRLRTGLRAVLGAAGTAALLVPLARRAGEPVPVVFVGCIVAMTAGSAVADRTRPRQARTLAVGGLAACASMAAAAFGMTVPWVGDALFCVVIFAAALARRFGPAGTAAGMFAFLSYFFALFAHTRPAQLPWTLGAIVAGTAVAALVRFAVVHERPARIFANTRRAFGARLVGVLGALAARVAEQPPRPRRWRRLRADAGRRLGAAELEGADLAAEPLRAVGECVARNCDCVAAALDHDGADGAAPVLEPVVDGLERLRRAHPAGPRRDLAEALADVAEQLAEIAAPAPAPAPAPA